MKLIAIMDLLCQAPTKDKCLPKAEQLEDSLKRTPRQPAEVGLV